MGQHLNQEERKTIERKLNESNSLRSISANLGKALSTITREVKKHRHETDEKPYGRIKNRCMKRQSCSHTGLCEDKPDCTRRCSTCGKCSLLCAEFIEEHCPKLSIPPYVCNGCTNKPSCPLGKLVYSANVAHKEYRSLLSEARAGFNLTDTELEYIDSVCSPRIKSGQSVYHVLATQRDKLFCSQRTVYRLIGARALSARNLDMPRVCRMKLRRNKQQTAKVDRACRTGRTIADFRSFFEQNQDIGYSEIDSVVGNIGGKVLLTLHVKSIDFMLAFIRDHNTAASVNERFAFLRNTLPPDTYRAMFSVLLGDNGSEFSDPRSIEYDESGKQVSRVFYCDPASPSQKPNVELNHELIRRCLPKGTSFDSLIQTDIDLMMSHINSYVREKFGGKSPAGLFADMFGIDALHLLGQELIDPANIILTPMIFKHRAI